MARMPRGEPRSVPDPDGERYDEMLRQENLKKARAEARAVPRFLPGADAGLPFSHPDFSKPNRSPVTMVDGRQIDTRCVIGGQAPVAAAELAEQRRAIERAFYMASNPLAGAAYGIATMAGASPQTRDTAMMAAGVFDAAMMGVAPRGVAIQRQPTAPRTQLVPEPFVRNAVRPRKPNSIKQAIGVDGTITSSMLGTGSKPDRNLEPPGWQGHGRIFNEARGHLLANALGGTGKEMWNLVTQTQQGSNTPQMRHFERAIAARVRGGEVIEYGAKPLYRDGVLPPSGILLTATGSRGAPTARIINNPAGRPR